MMLLELIKELADCPVNSDKYGEMYLELKSILADNLGNNTISYAKDLRQPDNCFKTSSILVLRKIFVSVFIIPRSKYNRKAMRIK